MTIDERFEFLFKSSESLHANLQELYATVSKQAEENRLQVEENRRQAEENRRRDQREAKLRSAMLAGIAEFLRGLENADGDAQPE